MVDMKALLKLPTSLREVVARASLPKASSSKRPNAGLEDEDEDAIALLPEGEKDGPTPTSSLHRGGSLVNGRTRKTWLLIALVGTGLILAAFLLPSRRRPPPPPPEEDLLKSEHYLHLVLPTTVSSADFCKTLLSAAVLNFPTPWLINGDWDEDSNENPALLKMRAIRNWLEGMPPERDEDPVAILGNVNAWFQVRPAVLLERYLGIRERGDRWIEETFEKKTIRKQRLSTKIVFSSEKECQTMEEGGSGCLAAAAEDGSLHYLSTNLVMGAVRDIRALWWYATKHAEALVASQSAIDENKIFAQILGDQETHRAAIAKPSWINKKVEEDFGIMLDFGRQLSYAADDKLEGVDWVKHTGSVEDEELSVPTDIAASTPPFWTFSASGDLPSNASWSDVPLLTGIRANIVPAIVQRSPKAAPELSATWWEKMWFQPYSRQLLDAFALIPSTPLAVLVDVKGKEQRYWSPHYEKVGAKDAELVFHDWGELCASEEFAEEVAGEVFLDGDGVWVDPRP